MGFNHPARVIRYRDCPTCEQPKGQTQLSANTHASRTGIPAVGNVRYLLDARAGSGALVLVRLPESEKFLPVSCSAQFRWLEFKDTGNR